MLVGLPWCLTVKNVPAVWEVQETQVRSLGRDLLEVEIAAHSKILAWEMPWAEEPGGLKSMGWQKSQTEHRDKATTHLIKCHQNIQNKSGQISREK